jgi:polysaccharide biosynthesis transport protein
VQSAKHDQTRVASKWLGSEIETLRTRVAEAEGKVEDFRSKSNLFVGTNNTTLSNQQMGELNSQLAIARSQKAESEAKARLIRNLLRSGQPIESSEISNSDLIRRLAEQGATLRAQLAEQSSTLLGNHPRIKELKAQIADLDRQTRQEGEKLVRAFENDARIAGGRLESLSANLDQLKRQATSTNEQDVVLRALEREAKAQRDLLESYLAKYREASARDSLGVIPAEARIISRAFVSNTPAFPKKLPIVLIATFATLFLSAGFITTGELLAGNVYRPEYPVADDVMAAAPPVLGTTAISHAASMPAVSDRHPEAVLAAEPPVADVAAPAQHAPAPLAAGHATDQLASGLRRSGESGRRIAIVGAARNIGTTSTAIALARALSEESRVVLIDLALGSPNIAAISNDPSAPGIAELVRGVASFRHIIARDRISRVHVIAAGRAPADINSVMTSERLAIGMNALARTYDHVVIDAGALPQIPLERLARLASHAVLVAPGMPDDATSAARDRLMVAGFSDVTTFSDVPPLPESSADGQNTAAA